MILNFIFTVGKSGNLETHFQPEILQKAKLQIGKLGNTKKNSLAKARKMWKPLCEEHTFGKYRSCHVSAL